MPASIKTAVLAIVGPTCTGKTDLSIELAHRFNGEIIALDSRTIYKKMNIGTAKPTTDQQNKVKHYAIDLTEPTRFFTVAEYIKVASEAIRIITSKGKLPILCGGTGLYARALLEGIQIPEVAPQEELRLQLNELANKNGNAALLSRLAELDSVAAGRLNLNDRRRIIRALEVCIVSGKPFSQIAIQGELPFQTTWIGLNWSDRDLHRRIISARLEKHLEGGLVEEVTELWKNEQYREILSNSVNYKEFVPYIDKNKSLEEACAECVRSNFQLARKQMMWFRARSFINWITLENAYSMSDLVEKSIKMLPDYLLHN